jgi:hypothetical protein
MTRDAATAKGLAGDLIWANLLHLGYNMWADRYAPETGRLYVHPTLYLRFDETLWDDLLQEMADAGMNMVVIDLGDGVQYESHPEIAVYDAWSTDRLKRELAKIRDLGMEPIPKLNFSTCHDTWLGDYSRCVSTDTYYAVCRELIAEVIALFDTPRFFHLGMDEETVDYQRFNNYVVIRQYDLWWHDLYFFLDQVERAGVRPWVWSDYIWHHPEAYLKKMPRSVLQSNWYYDLDFRAQTPRVRPYLDLDAHGYDQIPTGSNYREVDNFQQTVDFCRRHVAPERLLGFMQTVWQPTLEECRARHLQGIELVGRARAGYQRG